MRRAVSVLLALLVVVLVVPGGASAARYTIGDPIPPFPGIVPNPGSFRQDIVRADPVGGQPWELASFETLNASGAVTGFCTVIGRRYRGMVGQIDEHGVFHEFALGAGMVGCGGSEPGQDRAPVVIGSAYFQAFQMDAPCYPFTGEPYYPDAPPACEQSNMRSFQAGILGTGVIGGQALIDGTWEPIRVTRNGAYLVPRLGTGDEQLNTTVRFAIHACGPRARLSILRIPRTAQDGCVITYTFTPYDV